MDRQQVLTEAHQETVRALEQGRETLARLAGSRVVRRFKPVPDGVKHLAGAVADPGRFWGMAAAGALGGGDPVDDNVAAELAAAAIKAAAARLRVGDFGPVREAMLGQAAWLSATAVRLTAVADEIEPGQRAMEQRAELVKLALRASDQAAKVLASAAALNAIDSNASVKVE